MVFVLKEGKKYGKLGPSQFKRSFNPNCITYIEQGSKNYSGNASDLHLENEETHVLLCS